MSATSPACNSTINLDALTFTADELRSLNELVVTAVLEAPALSAFHTLVTGIKNDRHIGIIPGTFGLVGKAGQNCNPEAQCYELTAIQKTWEPKVIEIIIDMCKNELDDTLMKLATRCGVQAFDLTNTEVFAFILDILTKDIEKMLLRHAWFGDVTAANVNAGGVITNGYDVGFFNIIDGFFHQLAVIYAADTDRLTAIPGNTQVTYALQGTVATPLLTYTALNTVIDAALPELAAQPDRIILVTKSVMDRIRRQLQALGTVFQDYTLMINGLEFATWDGIKIVSIPLWDQWIRAYENNGTSYNNPHRIVYSTVSNLQIGMECNGLFDNINSFYDQRSRINRIEARDAFDAKIIDDRLVQVGT
ncbi:MAG TPA: hypothetical protein VMV77_08885 [Bacteroidales bacterium]|nr:hypothetical protein [Bacteroidales bacterium]